MKFSQKYYLDLVLQKLFRRLKYLICVPRPRRTTVHPRSFSQRSRKRRQPNRHTSQPTHLPGPPTHRQSQLDDHPHLLWQQGGPLHLKLRPRLRSTAPLPLRRLLLPPCPPMKSPLPPRCWATYPLPQVVDDREGGKEAVGDLHRLDSAETERNSSCHHNPRAMN